MDTVAVEWKIHINVDTPLRIFELSENWVNLNCTLSTHSMHLIKQMQYEIPNDVAIVVYAVEYELSEFQYSLEQCVAAYRHVMCIVHSTATVFFV